MEYKNRCFFGETAFLKMFRCLSCLAMICFILCCFERLSLEQIVYAEEQSEVYESERFSDFHSDELSLYARSAVILDADTGRILFGKSANTPMPNASTTKILTCILALEKGNPDDVVTVSDYACSMPKVKLGFSSGDQFYLKDLLYSLMLESHNDSAVAIAEHIGGSVEDFAGLMNTRAAELGCSRSHFITPNGLDAQDSGGMHQTTAYDLSKIMSYCIQNEEFLEITRTSSRQISTVDGEKSFVLNNHNALLTMLDGALSGKTGFTSKAGYCYVGAFRSGDHSYTFALLACGWPNHKDYKWSDSKELIQYADQHYSDRILVKGEKKKQIPLVGAVWDNGCSLYFPDSVEVKTGNEMVTGFLSDTDEVEICYDLPPELKAPVQTGDFVGTEKIYLNGVLYAERDMALTESAEKFDYSWCLRWMLHRLVLG